MRVSLNELFFEVLEVFVVQFSMRVSDLSHQSGLLFEAASAVVTANWHTTLENLLSPEIPHLNRVLNLNSQNIVKWRLGSFGFGGCTGFRVKSEVRR